MDQSHRGDATGPSTGRGPGADEAVGRPRDPGVSDRALHSALELFGRVGWAGFTFGGVAADARVGKSSLYLRWNSKEELLKAAFEAFDTFFTAAPGSQDMALRDRVKIVAEHRIRTYFEPAGRAVARLQCEYRSDPETFAGLWGDTINRAVLRTRAEVGAAIQTGELRPDTNLVALADALEGACLMHAISSPVELQEAVLAQLPQFVEDLVHLVLDPWLAP